VKEHKTENLEELLKWWPELRPLTEHAKFLGIRLVAEKDGKVSAFQFGEVEGDYEPRWCESNECEHPDCHRCGPRKDCETHEKCRDFAAGLLD
jgi:hypothetical protein